MGPQRLDSCLQSGDRAGHHRAQTPELWGFRSSGPLIAPSVGEGTDIAALARRHLLTGGDVEGLMTMCRIAHDRRRRNAASPFLTSTKVADHTS